MYQNEYERWLAADLEDADLKPELTKIKDNFIFYSSIKEIFERFLRHKLLDNPTIPLRLSKK